MVDQFTPEMRSQIMRAVKGSNTAPERRLRQYLTEMGLHFREQAGELPGRPDFAIDTIRLAIFVDGDFWHGRWWTEKSAAPASNRKYWITKFEKNAARDRKNTVRLRRSGWSVIRIWESDLSRDFDEVSQNLCRRITQRTRTHGSGSH